MQPMTMTETQPLQTRLRRTLDIPRLLRTVAAFEPLNDAQRTALAARMGVQAFVAGQTIFYEGDVGDALYLIARGQVRIYHPSATGHEVTVAIHRPGEIFGELALIDDQPRSASAVTMCPTVAVVLGQHAFQQLLRDHPAVATALLRELAIRLRNSTIAVYRTHLAAQQRVGGLILDLAQRYGVPTAHGTRIDLVLTQDDLASMCGLTRETINQVLGQLRDRGLVAIARKQIVVLDAMLLVPRWGAL